MGRRFALAALCACLLAAAAAPAAAVASSATDASTVAALALDGYDVTDDACETAREITGLVPGLGAPRVERHVTGAGAAAGPADEDWFRLTVGPPEAPADTYSIEAKALDASLDPVIEVYAEDTTPTPYPELPAAGDGVRTGTDPRAVAAMDGAAWIAGGSASLDFLPPAPGTYRVRVRPYYDAGYDGFANGFRAAYGPYDLRIKKHHATRLAGSDRISTALAVSRERFADSSLEGRSAVVASGYGFADALAGSTLAGAVGGPLLLTKRATLPTSVGAELDRLGVSRVYVLGGDAAVAAVVAGAIDRIPGVSVTRIAGSNRYETAAAVARKACSLGAGGTAKVAFIASGATFPDALSAAPMAAFNVAPVLLTAPGTLSGATRAALRDPALGITDAVIVGGTGAVSSGVAGEVARVLGGSGHVRRVAGEDRYRTSGAFAAWATGGGSGAGKVGTPANPSALDALAFGRMGLASGADFPDALAGGVASGLAGAPVLLTQRDRLSPWIFAGLDPFDGVVRGADYYSRGTTPLGRSYAFGGAAVLTQEVVNDLDWLTGRHLTAY